MCSGEKSCLQLEELHGEPPGDLKVVPLSGNLWAWMREGCGRRVRGRVVFLCLQSGLPTPQECPSGIVNEENFKQIYSQFFPQGGEGTRPERKQRSISRLNREEGSGGSGNAKW